MSFILILASSKPFLDGLQRIVSLHGCHLGQKSPFRFRSESEMDGLDRVDKRDRRGGIQTETDN